MGSAYVHVCASVVVYLSTCVHAVCCEAEHTYLRVCAFGSHCHVLRVLVSGSTGQLREHSC